MSGLSLAFSLGLTSRHAGGTTPPVVTDLALTISDTAPVVGQAVHFKVADAGMAAMAAAAGMGAEDYAAECEWLWEFSVGNAAEDYEFASLPADHIGNRTAGWALGPFVGHVYVDGAAGTPVDHTVRCSVYRRGALVAQGTATVSVGVREYATANMGFLAETTPVAGADGVPVGVTNLFTDFRAALLWLCAGDDRALFMRRGHTFTHTLQTTFVLERTLRTNAMIAAYDATGPHGTTGARPEVLADFRSTQGLINETPVSPQTVFTAAAALPANLYVYVNNVLRHPGEDYTVSGTDLTFGVAIPAGQKVQVFNNPGAGPRVNSVAAGGETEFVVTGLSFNVAVRVNGAALPASDFSVSGDTVTLTAALTAADRILIYDSTSFGRLLFVDQPVFTIASASSGLICRDVEFTGPHDPVSPGSFDPYDLTTAGPSHLAHGFQSGAATAGVTAQNLSFFRAAITRFGAQLAVSSVLIDVMGVVDCTLGPWGNYGLFIDLVDRLVVAGSGIRQDRFAVNGKQGKAYNAPIQSVSDPLLALNAAWHGPFRSARCIETAIHGNALESRQGWDGVLDGAQPVARLIQGSFPGQTYSLTQNFMAGGQGNFGGGAQNQQDMLTRTGLCHVGYNVMVIYPKSERASGTSARVSTFSNFVLLPEGTGASGNWRYLGENPTGGENISAPDVWLGANKAINDTFVLLDDRPADFFEPDGEYIVTSPGLKNVASSGTINGPYGPYVVQAGDVGGDAINVPLTFQAFNVQPSFVLRVWRAAPGADVSTATAAASWDEQVGVWDGTTWVGGLYDVAFEGRATNDPNATGRQTTPLDQGGPSTFVTVTRKNASPAWAEGDQVWLTMEQTATSIVDEDATEGLVFGFNNRTEAVTRVRPTLHNTLTIVDGNWANVEIGGVLQPATDFEPGDYGGFDAYWRPEAGNNVIGAASGIRSAFDVFGKLRTGRAKGALEPDSNVTGLPPLPIRAPSVSVALSPAGYTVGDSFSTANVIATIADAGVPALTLGDIQVRARVYNSSGVLVTELAPGDAAVTLEAGQRVEGRLRWTHITTPIRTAQTVQVEVAAISFNPQWVESAFTLASPYTGSQVNRSGLAATVDTDNQHFAFRFRNRHTNTGQPVARMFFAEAIGGIPNDVWIDFSPTGVMRLRGAKPSQFDLVTLGTVPNTGGLCSLLVSVYFNGDGPDDLLPSRNGTIAWVKIDSGAVTPFVITDTPKRLFGNRYRLFSTIGGSIDMDFQQYFGTWVGGAPTFASFFETDGTVKQWAAGLGVSGMTQHNLLSGVGAVGVVGTFNGHLASGATAWIDGGPLVP